MRAGVIDGGEATAVFDEAELIEIGGVPINKATEPAGFARRVKVQVLAKAECEMSGAQVAPKTLGADAVLVCGPTWRIGRRSLSYVSRL